MCIQNIDLGQSRFSAFSALVRLAIQFATNFLQLKFISVCFSFPRKINFVCLQSCVCSARFYSCTFVYVLCCLFTHLISFSCKYTKQLNRECLARLKLHPPPRKVRTLINFSFQHYRRLFREYENFVNFEYFYTFLLIWWY